MEMQQMIERLLAGQAKAEADRKAMQEKADADRTRQEQILKATQEKADADRTRQEQILKAMQELQDIKSGQAEMIAAIKWKTDALLANIKDARKKTTACQEVTRATCRSWSVSHTLCGVNKFSK
jgi:hypothetical protein